MITVRGRSIATFFSVNGVRDGCATPSTNTVAPSGVEPIDSSASATAAPRASTANATPQSTTNATATAANTRTRLRRFAATGTAGGRVPTGGNANAVCAVSTAGAGIGGVRSATIGRSTCSVTAAVGSVGVNTGRSTASVTAVAPGGSRSASWINGRGTVGADCCSSASDGTRRVEGARSTSQVFSHASKPGSGASARPSAARSVANNHSTNRPIRSGLNVRSIDAFSAASSAFAPAKRPSRAGASACTSVASTSNGRWRFTAVGAG